MGLLVSTHAVAYGSESELGMPGLGSPAAHSPLTQHVEIPEGAAMEGIEEESSHGSSPYGSERGRHTAGLSPRSSTPPWLAQQTPQPEESLYEQFIHISGFSRKDVDETLGILLHHWFDRHPAPAVYDALLQIALDYDSQQMYSAKKQQIDRPSLQRTCNLLETLLRCNDQWESGDYIWHLYNTVMKQLPHGTLLHERAVRYLHQTHESYNWKKGFAPLAFRSTLQLIWNEQTIGQFDRVGGLVARICGHYHYMNYDYNIALYHLTLLTQQFAQDPSTKNPCSMLEGALTAFETQRHLARQQKQGAFYPYSNPVSSGYSPSSPPYSPHSPSYSPPNSTEPS